MSSAVVNEALQFYSRGSVDAAREVLDAAVRSAEARNELASLFSVCCVRATMAAMEGSEDVASLMASCEGVEHQAELTQYLEGLSALARCNYERARLKFESLEKQTAGSDPTGAPSPTCFLADIGLAAVHMHNKRFKQAFRHYRRVLEALGTEVTPRVVRVGMGMCAFQLQHTVLAKRILEREAALHPDNDFALFALLVVYVDLRLMPLVVDTVVKLRARLPDNTALLLRAADLLYFRAVEHGNVRSAVPSIQALITRVRETGTGIEGAYAAYQEGRLQVVLGNFPEAVRLLEGATAVLPNLLPLRIHYCHLLLLMGREDDGLRLLTLLNRQHPNQKEVLQLLACHDSDSGRHGAALQSCTRLMESVDVGSLESLSLSSWCSRLNTTQCASEHERLIKLLSEQKAGAAGGSVPITVLANAAVLKGDTAALQSIVDRTLGGGYLTDPPLLEHVPLVYNLGLLQKKDGVTDVARRLFILLVKSHPTFADPYFQLHLLAKEAGDYRKAVSWLTLLTKVLEGIPSTRNGATLQIAKSFIGVTFFEQKKHRVAVTVLRQAAGLSRGTTTSRPSNQTSTISLLCLASAYLRCSQMRGRSNTQYLKHCKALMTYVLRRDASNLLAAEGLSCCLGIEDDANRAQVLLNRTGQAVPCKPYVLDSHQLNVGNVRCRLRHYAQTIDILLKEPTLTGRQEATLGLCYAMEGRFPEARAALERAVKLEPDMPMLLYNIALVTCCSFVDGVLGVSSGASVGEGKELREVLLVGFEWIMKFLSAEPNSRDMLDGQAFLKRLGAYCSQLYQKQLTPLVLVGTENVAQESRDADQWAAALGAYKQRVAKEEELKKEAQQHESDERKEAEAAVQKRFDEAVFTLDGSLMGAALLEHMANEEEFNDFNDG